jgi:hypothetical protein
MNFRESSLYLNLVSSLHESCRTLQYVVETTPSRPVRFWFLFTTFRVYDWLIVHLGRRSTRMQTIPRFLRHLASVLWSCDAQCRFDLLFWPFCQFLVVFTLLLFRVLSTDENLPIQTSNCWSGGTFRVHSPKAVDLTLRKLSWTFERNVLRWRMWILNGCK